tara:strand:+ start:1974 stop:3827 length:1854 start_codon:yes stop_codon:yes gene_type:complete
MVSLKDINSSIEEGNDDLEKLNDNFSKWFDLQKRSRLDDLEDKRELRKLLGKGGGAGAGGKNRRGGGIFPIGMSKGGGTDGGPDTSFWNYLKQGLGWGAAAGVALPIAKGVTEKAFNLNKTTKPPKVTKQYLDKVTNPFDKNFNKNPIKIPRVVRPFGTVEGGEFRTTRTRNPDFKTGELTRSGYIDQSQRLTERNIRNKNISGGKVLQSQFGFMGDMPQVPPDITARQGVLTNGRRILYTSAKRTHFQLLGDDGNVTGNKIRSSSPAGQLLLKGTAIPEQAAFNFDGNKNAPADAARAARAANVTANSGASTKSGFKKVMSGAKAGLSAVDSAALKALKFIDAPITGAVTAVQTGVTRVLGTTAGTLTGRALQAILGPIGIALMAYFSNMQLGDGTISGRSAKVINKFFTGFKKGVKLTEAKKLALDLLSDKKFILDDWQFQDIFPLIKYLETIAPFKTGAQEQAFISLYSAFYNSLNGGNKILTGTMLGTGERAKISQEQRVNAGGQIGTMPDAITYAQTNFPGSELSGMDALNFSPNLSTVQKNAVALRQSNMSNNTTGVNAGGSSSGGSGNTNVVGGDTIDNSTQTVIQSTTPPIVLITSDPDPSAQLDNFRP